MQQIPCFFRSLITARAGAPFGAAGQEAFRCQLRLEQSTWAAHARIEKLAREKLAMRPPLPGQVIAIEERP